MNTEPDNFRGPIPCCQLKLVQVMLLQTSRRNIQETFWQIFIIGLRLRQSGSVIFIPPSNIRLPRHVTVVKGAGRKHCRSNRVSRIRVTDIPVKFTQLWNSKVPQSQLPQTDFLSSLTKTNW